jgi:hypothetical protein
MAHENQASSLSKSRSIEEMAEFWDTHDAADYDEQTQPVEIEFDLETRRHYIAIDPELQERLRKLAQARGISLESLANLWLQERALAAER